MDIQNIQCGRSHAGLVVGPFCFLLRTQKLLTPVSSRFSSEAIVALSVIQHDLLCGVVVDVNMKRSNDNIAPNYTVLTCSCMQGWNQKSGTLHLPTEHRRTLQPSYTYQKCCAKSELPRSTQQKVYTLLLAPSQTKPEPPNTSLCISVGAAFRHQKILELACTILGNFHEPCI